MATRAGHPRTLDLDAFLQPYPSRTRLLQDARELYSKLEFQEAERRSLELFQIAKRARDTLCQAQALVIAGNSQRELANYHASRCSFNAMKKLAKDKQNGGMINDWATTGIGLARLGLGEYSEGRRILQRDIRDEFQLDDSPGQDAAYGNLETPGVGISGKIRRVRYYERRLEAVRKRRDKPGLGIAYSHLGVEYRKMGMYDKAITCHKKHLGIAIRMDDTLSKGYALGNIGYAYQVMGDYREAIRYHTQCLSIAKKATRKVHRGACLLQPWDRSQAA